MFQTPSTPDLTRLDHIWSRTDIGWICITCGAITFALPPEMPTDVNWKPARYQKLTDKERNLAPYIPTMKH